MYTWKPFVKEEPKKSALEIFVKVVIVVGIMSAIAVAAYIVYRKFSKYMRELVADSCDDYLDDCCYDCEDECCECCEFLDECESAADDIVEVVDDVAEAVIDADDAK